MPYSPVAPQAAASVPWASLLLIGLMVGAVVGVVWQVWLRTEPLLANPPLPPFAQNLDSLLVPPAVTTEQPAVANNSQGQASGAAGAVASTANPDEEDKPLTERPDEVPWNLAQGDRGRVIEPIGLAIRAKPEAEAPYLGGIPANESVTVLGTSGDGAWQRVRRELNGQEGWVKAGNISPL